MDFKNWLKKHEMVGTSAIYDGSKTYDKKRDWNWWGAPESAIKVRSKRKKKK
jgi:hypothetical protein